MSLLKGIGMTALLGLAIAPMMANASAGCGEITSITQANKEPMDDIYRLNKQGVATGGLFTQLLSAIPGVGIASAVIGDAAIGALASDVKITSAEDKLRQEAQTQQYLDVYDVTIKPDYGDPITITIRENEISFMGLKKDRRAIIYYPNTDPIVTTGENARITRTRPSFSKKVVFGWYDAPDKPAQGVLPDEHYNDVCYRGQKTKPFFNASGPWGPNSIGWQAMTDDEIRQTTNDYAREVSRLELRKKYLLEQEPGNAELAQVELEAPKYKLLYAQGMAYARKMDNSADWRIKNYEDEIKQLKDQVALLKKNDPRNLLSENSEQARFQQSMAYRLKESSEKSGIQSTNQSVK